MPLWKLIIFTFAFNYEGGTESQVVQLDNLYGSEDHCLTEAKKLAFSDTVQSRQTFNVVVYGRCVKVGVDYP